MLRLPLVLLVLAQIDLPQPSFAYSDGTACGDAVLTWSPGLSEVLWMTLPGNARDIDGRVFEVGRGRGRIELRVFFSTGGFRKCGTDLGPWFGEVLTGPPDWTGISGSALVYLSDHKKTVTVVLREVTFKASGRRFTVPRVLRVKAELNDSVPG